MKINLTVNIQKNSPVYRQLNHSPNLYSNEFCIVMRFK